MFDERIKRYAFLIFVAALLFQLIFSDGGVMGYIKLKREMKSISASMTKLEKENIDLAKEIDRIQKDDQYLEELARKKFGLVREGEKLYRMEK